MKREGFLSDLGRKDQSLVERIVAWLQDMLSKFREYFQNPTGKLTRAQSQRMANELGRMAKNIVNQNGKKIFRYNAKTHTLHLATGESLDKLNEAAEREAVKSKEAAQTKKASASEDNRKVAEQFGGRVEDGQIVFDDDKDEAAYRQHLENMQSPDGFKYSLNDYTSPEKLKAKIQNIFTETKNERTRNHMRKLLEKLSGYRIRTGRFAKGIAEVADNVAKVIRARTAYDWETILPAVGKLVAEHLKLNPSDEMNNYIANWFIDGAPNDNSTTAQEFQRAMREADDMYRSQLLEVRELFDEWNKRKPEEIVSDTIAHGKPEKPLSAKGKDFLYGGYSQFIEELYPIKQLVDDFEEELGRKLTDAENPYVLLRNYRGMAGRAKIMVEEGAPAIEALKAALPNVNFDKFKTVAMILESVGADKDPEKRKEFSSYLLACAVKDLHNLNNANLRQQEQLKATIDRLEYALDDLETREEKAKTKKLIKQRKAELAELQTQIYATPFSEKVCDGTIAKYKDTYGAAQQDMMNYQRTLLDIMVDSGLLSEKNRDEYITRYPSHVPLFRAFDENEDVSFGDSLKMMKGSTRDVIDPLESIVRNTYSFIRRAEKNKAKLALVNLSRIGGAGEIFDEVSKPNNATHTTITFYENGEKKYLDSDRAIVKTVNNLSAPHMSWFMKFIRIGTMLLRNFATVYNPAFALRNLVMDNQNAFLYSKYGYFSPADFVKGFLSVFNRDADFQEWMAMGGAQASFWSVDRDYTQASLDKLTKGKWGQYKSVKGFFKLFAVLGEYSELGTRVGYYKKVKKALAEKNGGKIDRADLITAALESRDLTDFARGGNSSRTWNSWAAFANASIQGWDKFFRTFDLRQLRSKDETVRKNCERAWIRLALWSIVPTVFLFMINHDKDWYEKDLPDWERQTHWIFGETVRVPKGQDVGLRFFSNLTESILRSMSGDKKAFQNAWKPLYESLPDVLPTAIQPIIEDMTNYDMFRKNAIVPQRQQRLPEYMQYDSRTSALAKDIGDSSLVKFFVGETGLSPEKIDHFIYGYTGKMGRETIRKFDTIRGARNYDLKLPSDIPLIGGFFRTPYITPRILTEYYDQLDEQTKLHNEFKMTKQRPEGYNHGLYTRLTNAQKEMQKFAKRERAIIDDPRLDFDLRDERQKALQKKRVALAERALR